MLSIQKSTTFSGQTLTVLRGRPAALLLPRRRRLGRQKEEGVVRSAPPLLQERPGPRRFFRTLSTTGRAIRSNLVSGLLGGLNTSRQLAEKKVAFDF
jgi:hypothetical protein